MTTIAAIKVAVAARYSLPLRVMSLKSGRGRQPFDVTRPRQVAMTLARWMTPHSRATIGRHFGGRDPTTVLHAEREVEKRVETDPHVRANVNALILELAGIA